MQNPVLETTKRVIEKSAYISINREAISTIARQWKKEHWQLPPWDFSYHFFDGSERTLTYLFLLDSINFSFWPSSASSYAKASEDKKATKGKQTKLLRKYRRTYGGKKLEGYNALAFSLKLAFLKKHPIEKPEYLLRLKKGEFLNLLDGKGKLPLLEKRLNILHQHALVLKKKFAGNFANVVKEAKSDATMLVSLLVTNFPSFNDFANFEGENVDFYKRAQLLVNDIATIYRGKGMGEFKHLDSLTAFADYKLPQILRHWGILEYQKPLAKMIDAQKQLRKGSREETEIRASTIWAVEFLKEALAREGIAIESREIDWLLWKRAKEEKGMKPYHRIRTIYY